MRTTYLVLALVVCVSGCGGSGGSIDESEGDLKDIKNMVTILNDIDVPESWKKLFVDGAAPDDLAPYDEPIFIFENQNVTISGDAAEFDVLVVTDLGDTDGDGVTDEREDTMTWTAQKVGNKWKLKTAPLP